MSPTRTVPTTDRADRLRWLGRVLRAPARWLRDAFVSQTELHERWVLRNRPWAEEFLHWARTPDGWELHGRLAPPPGWRRYSVTGTGWCPGLSGPAGPAAPRKS